MTQRFGGGWLKSGGGMQNRAKYLKQWKAANPDKVAEYNRREWQKKDPAKVAENRKRWAAKNPDKMWEYNRRWCEASRARKAAHRQVRAALLAGVIQRRPCEACGAEAHAHHEDYLRPLDVVWLCPEHHKPTQRTFGASERRAIRVLDDIGGHGGESAPVVLWARDLVRRARETRVAIEAWRKRANG